MWLFRRKTPITVLNKDWSVLKNRIKVSHVPRRGEMLFFEKEQTYYQIVNVVHNFKNKHGIFIIVEKVAQQDVTN